MAPSEAWKNCELVGSPRNGTEGLQSTRADILKAYGKPSVETVPKQGQKNMIYDAIGIDFQVYDAGSYASFHWAL
jgi:hypothetical protein